MTTAPSWPPAPDLSGFRHLLVYGGTFDPPHRAHIELPELARQQLGADALLYIPAAQSPHKLGTPPTPARHRLAMLQLALADEPHARILTDELQRGDTERPSYTVDTLTALRQRVHPDARLRLLIGTDQLLAFDRWHRWQDIVAMAEPAVMLRAPLLREEALAALPPALDPTVWAPRLLELPVMDVAATRLRAWLTGVPESQADNTPALNPAVLAYIHQHRLYRETKP